MGGKLLNGINVMYINTLTCGRVKGVESECFRMDSGERQGCIMSPWFFNVYTDAVMEEEKMGMGRREVVFQEERREWILPGLLYADDLVLCGSSEEDLRAMLERFVSLRCLGEKV